MENSLEILKTIPYSQLYLWDVKRFAKIGISSKYNIVQLSNYITERNEKVKLFEFPEKEFGILGVNNKIGLFDAYREFGKNINQAYKRVENHDLAYNPYRINVGSIGWKTENQKYDFISPAYVVFKTQNGLSSEFLYRMFKTDTFNKIIRDNTTGSVRQNLKFSTLSNINIPLPQLTEQNRLVANYNSKIKLANEQEQKAKELEQEIEEYLFEVLGIKKFEEKSKQLLKIVQYSNLNRWDNAKSYILNSKYPVIKVKDIIEYISTGTTPPTSRKEYFENGKINFYTPADLTDKMYLLEAKRKITKLAIENGKARKFKKYTLLFVGIGSTIGKVGIIANEFATSNQQITGLYFDRTKSNIEYLYYYFSNFQNITTYERTQATLPIVNQEKILDIPIPLPPIKIQIKIANYISNLKQQIKDLKSQAEENREKAIKEFENEIFIKN